MLCLPEDGPEVWAVIGPDSLLDALAPLIEERRRRGATAVLTGEARDIEAVAGRFGGRRATLLVVEDPSQESARSRYSAPFLARAEGPEVLLGWVRLTGRELVRYARRAAALLRRQCDVTKQPLVLLAPRERRYLDLLEDLEGAAAPHCDSLRVFRWSAERIRRARLLEALHLGAAMLLYTGHGNRDGWFAYGGMRAATLAAGTEWSDDDTNALMFSLSCSTGQPLPCAGLRSGFADTVISHGIAGAVVAPLGEYLHQDNRLLARALVRSLGSSQRKLPDILGAAKSGGASLQGYAVIGDPALNAVAAASAVYRGERVFAPAADADLSCLTA